MIEKYIHYLKRIQALGLQQSAIRAARKVKEIYIKAYWRKEAYNGTAAYTWREIVKKHGYGKSFEQFCENREKQKLSFLSELYQHIPEKQIITHADLFTQNYFDLLGSGVQQFKALPWHIDFRLKAQHQKSGNIQHSDFYLFDKTLFYQDRPNLTHNAQALHKDIKVPWELSRCYHFFVLARAYKITGNKKYADIFYAHINDWIKNNPYLFGINWMCPMEVGLRAVNWIVAYSSIQFACSKSLRMNGRQEEAKVIVESLYNHFIYLENNWEIYDGRTSNHYLSNLIGYFYLCWFFRNLPGIQKKQNWCYTEFLREWDKQIFNEGTDYEGSTAYHRLVTEIFYHFYLLCQEFGLPLPKKYEKKLERMFTFIEWCTPCKGKLIAIGDDDSGRVLFYPFLPNPTSSRLRRTLRVSEVKNYKEFGLSIIKTKQWHVILRQHAYQRKQPNGHYHADVGSVTVAIDDIALFADPGSYMYTPSVYWRNYFRAYKNHNTFFLKDNEPIAIDERLFMLPIPEKKWEPGKKLNDLEIVCTHALYKNVSLYAKRKVILNQDNNQLIVADKWLPEEKNKNKKAVVKRYVTYWNFVVGQRIMIEKEEKEIHFFYQNKLLAKLYSPDVDFQVSDAWIAPGYGTKVKTKRLRAQKELAVGQVVTIVIEVE